MVEQMGDMVGAPTIFAPRLCFSVSAFPKSPSLFDERCQLFIGAHDESLCVTVRVNDPDVGADAFDSYRWPCTFAM